ncbi:MAG: chromosomal replication initiator protein DnaA [Candidatus Gracilibacteria bacterium]|nr:chromosomal replication initiator protein DnaA [Candidatus Gracilibacteria bacterium]
MVQKELWVSILNRLKPTIQRAHFVTWFQNTTVLDVKDGKMIVGVPTSFAFTWMKDKYATKILQAANELDSSISVVEFEVSGNLDYKNLETGAVDPKVLFIEDDKKVRKVRDVNEVVVSKGKYSPKVTSQMMNNRYTLSNFVIGKDNRLPHAASQAVANMPGSIYNPLYVYGSVGLGKTHLVQAIGNEILKNFPDKVVKYITAERFVTEVVEAIGKRYMHKFKDQYRKVDVFIVDDIQFFARKDSSQQEFFHTFNELYEGNKQIVVTSDRQPAELDGLDDRLKSRFGMGMVVELLMPDYETRLAILNQKCREAQMIVDPEVLAFIANNVTDSVRALDGVLRQVMAEAQLTDRVPTLRTAAEVIRRLNKAQKIIGFDIEAKQMEARAKSAIDVMNIVAEYYGVDLEQLKGVCRHTEIMVPRQICMYLIKNELGDSYEKIGSVFGGKNHTTVMHACNKITEKLKTNIRLVRDLNSIKKEMGLGIFKVLV